MSRLNRPRVVAHVAVSLDGATTGFPVDVGRFYELASTWREDVILAGADTILAQEGELARAPRPGPTSEAPLLAVVDSRGRVREWEALRDCGYWSGVVAVCSHATPRRAERAQVPELVVGTDRVDLVHALEMLAQEMGAGMVRVDSGGSLTGALLRWHLVDELSFLVHPCTAGAAGDRRWHGPEPVAALRLTHLGAKAFDDGLVWLRYRIDGTAT
jgi:2,5-diamino-6-(ribosylamino)-4(3H)-pyrimidinone 5'-phosphate reductase